MLTVNQGAGDEMGRCVSWCERFPQAGGEVIADAESGVDGYGEYLDEVVLCDQACEYVVCGPFLLNSHWFMRL